MKKFLQKGLQVVGALSFIIPFSTYAATRTATPTTTTTVAAPSPTQIQQQLNDLYSQINALRTKTASDIKLLDTKSAAAVKSLQNLLFEAIGAMSTKMKNKP